MAPWSNRAATPNCSRLTASIRTSSPLSCDPVPRRSRSRSADATRLVTRAIAFAILLSLLGPEAVLLGADGRAEGRQVSREHPDWLLPSWTADGPALWTTV